MLVQEPVLANTETNKHDVWHWYPARGRKEPWKVTVGDKAYCGFICDQNQFNAYPNGSECVVCAELRKT